VSIDHQINTVLYAGPRLWGGGSIYIGRDDHLVLNYSSTVKTTPRFHMCEVQLFLLQWNSINIGALTQAGHLGQASWIQVLWPPNAMNITGHLNHRN